MAQDEVRQSIEMSPTFWYTFRSQKIVVWSPKFLSKSPHFACSREVLRSRLPPKDSEEHTRTGALRVLIAMTLVKTKTQVGPLIHPPHITGPCFLLPPPRTLACIPFTPLVSPPSPLPQYWLLTIPQNHHHGRIQTGTLLPLHGDQRGESTVSSRVERR